MKGISIFVSPRWEIKFLSGGTTVQYGALVRLNMSSHMTHGDQRLSGVTSIFQRRSLLQMIGILQRWSALSFMKCAIYIALSYSMRLVMVVTFRTRCDRSLENTKTTAAMITRHQLLEQSLWEVVSATLIIVSVHPSISEMVLGSFVANVIRSSNTSQFDKKQNLS